MIDATISHITTDMSRRGPTDRPLHVGHAASKRILARMCGRYVTGTDEHDWRSWATLLELTTTTELPKLPDAFVPTATVPIVRHGEHGNELAWARWGLAPSWLARPLQSPPQYNVRLDTAPKKFKKYFETRRCVLPASGFWVRCDGRSESPRSPADAGPSREGKGEQVFVRVPEAPLFGLAGLWTERELDGETLRSCTILTTEADAELGRLHDRMPIVLLAEQARRWLDPECTRTELDALCASRPAFALAAA